MRLVGQKLVQEGETMAGRRVAKKTKKSHLDWIETFSKRALSLILIVSLIDLQLSYVLAFMDKVQIAESLSSNIATVIVGSMLGYFGKALFETFLEKREERLRLEHGISDKGV